MEELKKAIKNFWNKKPCGTFGFVSDNPDISYFNKIKERRYKLEPFIKKEIILSNLKGKKVLEIGCGIGTDDLEIAKTGADYTGIDASENSLKLARRNFELNNMPANLLFADAENLPFSDESFDFIYSWGVLHHTPDIEKALAEVRRVLKIGGRFCIMLYNRYSLVGFQLYIIYGLFRLKPFISWKKLFSEHHESPGTMAFMDKEAYNLFRLFNGIKIKNIITSYDLRITKNKFLPLFFGRLIPSRLGFFKVITGKK